MTRLTLALILLTYPAIAGETISGTARARDGDTLVVAGVPVRLNGVAAPEYNAKHPERSEPGGAEATAAMVRMIAGRVVTCELNGQRTHDRMVGVCYVDGRDIGAAIIAAGHARDCMRFSGGRYRSVETPSSRRQPLPAYCTPR